MKKFKILVSFVALLLSILALYTFIFVSETSSAWRVILIIIAIAWILSGVSKLIVYLGKKK